MIELNVFLLGDGGGSGRGVCGVVSGFFGF